MSLIALFVMLALAICLVLAVTFILRGVRGPLEASAPHCRRCRYELRQILITGSTNCPECGADLGERRAVAFGRPRRSLKLVLLGVGFIVLPIVAALGIGYFMSRAAGGPPTIAAGPQAYPTMTAAELAAAAGQDPSGPWLWQEIEARWDAGVLAPEDMATIIEGVIAGLQSGLSQRIGLMGWGSDFIKRILHDPKVPEAARRKLAEALAPIPTIDVPPRVREGSKRWASIRIPTEDIARDEDVLLALHDIRIVGAGIDRPLETRSSHFDGEADDPPLRFTGSRSSGNRFDIPTDLSPGRYEVRADIEWAAMLTKPALVGAFGRPRHPDHWPEAMIRRRTKLVAPLEIISAGEQLVEFLPPEESKIATEAFRRKMGRLGLKVAPDRRGRFQVSLLRPSFRGESQAHAYCFEVIAVLGETEIPLGRIAGYAGGQRSSGLSARIDALPDDVTTAEVLLRPAPNEADRMLPRDVDGNLPPIIGETIRLTDVPLDRGGG